MFTGKDSTFLYSTKTVAALSKNFRSSLLSYKDKAALGTCKKIPKGGKKLASCCPGLLLSWPPVVLASCCPGLLLSWSPDVLASCCPGLLLSCGGISHPMPPHGHRPAKKTSLEPNLPTKKISLALYQKYNVNYHY